VTSLVIYSRPGCHLCEEMKKVVELVARSIPLALQEIDISTDPVLDARYSLEIPVLIVDGKRAAKYRVTAEELMRVLLARAGGPGGAGGRGG